MYLNIAPEVSRTGLSAAALVARDVGDARQSPALAAYRRQVAQRLAAGWKNRSVSSDAVLAEHRRLANGESSVPEKLVSGLRRQRDLPAASALLDCCNIVAARTLLCARAAALAEPTTPATLRADGSYVGADGQPLPELPVAAAPLQSPHDTLLLLHGNRLLPAATLLKGAWLLAELLETFCGAHAELVGFVEGETAAPEGTPAAGKPQISFETFQRLTLRTGTVLAAAAHAGQSLPGLAVVTLRAAAETRALAPASILGAQLVGASVLVATGLHPLAVDGERHTDYLLTVRGPSDTAALRVDASTSIPDGERLY